MVGVRCCNERRWREALLHLAEGDKARRARFPGIQGRTRHADGSPQQADRSILMVACKHLTSPLRPLLGRARMTSTHMVLPDTLVDVAHRPYAAGSFRASWSAGCTGQVALVTSLTECEAGM